MLLLHLFIFLFELVCVSTLAGVIVLDRVVRFLRALVSRYILQFEVFDNLVFPLEVSFEGFNFIVQFFLFVEKVRLCLFVGIVVSL